ncbi:MAG TPA: chemotaxis protein CheX [Bryobacteraceae bacterium]|nr:chemotaxis protein CheX [Bryobacteraceae bacterium]
MSLHELMVDLIRQSSANVFSTMLGVELEPGAAVIENGTPEANDGVVSFIGLAGAWIGTGSVSCSPTLACRICSAMLMVESTGVDEDVLDAVAELTNMIVGSIKNDLETHLGPLGLSLPTVVFGRNFRTKSAGTTEWTVVRFPWEQETLVVKLCLSPAEKSHANCHMMGQTCALDV